MVKYSPGRTKTILNKLKNIDSWFWCRYTLNPYRGCEHACVYCDGRSERNYLHDDFEGMIFYKKNAPKLLKYKLKNARNLIPDIIAAGGTCDAYQPAEKKFKITQKILKIVKKYRWPICISTKNTLIQRDLEIFDQIGKDTYAAINFSFSTVNDEIAKYFEPGASSPSERLEVINLISRQFPNINVGINYMPIIPLIEDSHQQTRAVIENVANSGAEYVIFAPHLTLRDSQKTFFFKKLKLYAEKYLKDLSIYRKFLSEYINDKNKVFQYRRRKNVLIFNLCKKFGLQVRAPRWYPNDFRKQNYKAAEHLLHKHYISLIKGREKPSYMWAAFEIQNLEVSLGALAVRGQLNTTKNLDSNIYHDIKKFIKKPTTLDNFMRN